MKTIPAHRVQNYGRLNSLDALKSLDVGGVDQYVASYTKDVPTNEQLHVVFTSLTEAHAPSDMTEYAIKKFAEQNIKVTLLINSYMNHWDSWLQTWPCDIVYVDYFLWRTYCEIELKKINAVNLHWNPDSSKFLFLTGKPNKTNRARLLWKLHQQRLLYCCSWSLFVDQHNIDSVHEHLPELSRADLETFLKEFANNPDQVNVVQHAGMDLHYGGIPYDQQLFADTRFRLIAESYMHHEYPWITEKTWITMANMHPFVMAGDVGTCHRLQNMGFRTFEAYLKFPDYDSITNSEMRLDAAVQNTQHLLTEFQYDAQIRNEVEHNRQRFLELGQSNHKKICDFFTHYDIPEYAKELYIFSRDIIYDEHMTKINQTKETQ